MTKKKSSSSPTVGRAQNSKETPELGDEFDQMDPLEIAKRRFKRNHDFMSEVLSPYPICMILLPDL